MLLQRVITASILALVVLLTIFKLPPMFLIGLVIVVSSIALYEFLNLIKIRNTLLKLVLIAIAWIVGWLVLISIEHNPVLAGFFMVLVVTFWVYNLLIVVSYNAIQEINKTIDFFKALLIFIPLPSIIIFLSLEHKPLLLLLLFLAWGADVFAYFIGKTFGKNKLTPKLSSSKTIEGVIGGLAGVVLITLVFLYWQNIAIIDYPKYLLVTVITGIFSVVGDLYESIYKRRVGVKDSGYILPGHGGMLDRIDSVLAAAPIFATGMLVI